MRIYQDLFFNNLNNFLSNNFPVFRSLVDDHWWQREVRCFMKYHQCRSPFFSEIGREYIDYVLGGARPATPEDPPFMVELLHYEWVELALQIAPDPELPPGLEEDLLDGHPVLSPLAWPLEYDYPVHRIGPDFQPDAPPEQPTWLLVYRDKGQKVSFMALNALTARLLALIEQYPDNSARQLLERIGAELPDLATETLINGGEQTLRRFHEQGIVLGARPVEPRA